MTFKIAVFANGWNPHATHVDQVPCIGAVIHGYKGTVTNVQKYEAWPEYDVTISEQE